MGYTHYWAYRADHPGYADAWPAIVAGPRGDQSPIVDPDSGIAFNGDAAASP